MKNILFIITTVSLCFATVINVPADYPTIQAAINISSEGDTILVNTGFYYENIDFLNKDILIMGSFINSAKIEHIIQTVIYPESNQSTVTFGDVGQNNNAKLYGVSIYSENIAVQFNNTEATIERCLIYNPYQGFAIYCNASSPNIKNCTIRGFSSAVYSDDSSYPIISNSILWSEDSGIIGSGTVEYSCIRSGINGSITDLGGNISSDPIFDIPFYSGIELGWRQREYPWVGYPLGPNDGKDNNPWKSGIPSTGGTIANARWGVNSHGDTLIIGDGEANHGDLDSDGIAGEDWFNGFDDDGDGEIDEDYFWADGLDNAEPFTDLNDNGIYDLGEPFEDWDSNGGCDAENNYIDENIDRSSDIWYDGYDNDGTGGVDDIYERSSNPGQYYPTWANNIENQHIILFNGRISPIFHGDPNNWYDPNSEDPHLRGDFQWDAANTVILFDNFIFDFGEDGIPGDPFDDLAGDNQLQVGEPLSIFGTFGSSLDVGLDGIPDTFDEGEGDSIWQPGDGWIDFNGNGIVDLGTYGEYHDGYIAPNPDSWNDVWPPSNGIWNAGEPIYDFGIDGLLGTGDPGEGDGLHAYDNGESDGYYDTGDGCFGCVDDFVANWQSMPGIPDVGSETLYPFFAGWDGVDNDGDGQIDETGERGGYEYTLFRYFKIEALSPAIDTGDPDLNHDSDGTRIDMGALPLNQFIYGCTDPTFCDWNDLANIDDGSCNNILEDSEVDCHGFEYADGIDNDGDWEIWADEFGWEGDIDQDGNPIDFGEWGFVEYITDGMDTLGYNIYHPWEVFSSGANFKPEYDFLAQFWKAVGVDEYHKLTGIPLPPIVNVILTLGEYTPTEDFTDIDGDDIWDDENWTPESGYTPMEEYTDVNDNDKWDKGGWEVHVDWEVNTIIQPGYYLDLNDDQIPDWGSDNSIEYLFDQLYGDTYTVYVGNEIIAENVSSPSYVDYNISEDQYVCYSVDFQSPSIRSIPYNEQCLITPNSDLSIDENILPSEFELYPIYPNPFNPVANIRFSLPTLSVVKINVYDLLGRQIEVLHNNTLTPGYHTVTWNASQYSSGIYFVRIIAEEYHAVQKVMLVK